MTLLRRRDAGGLDLLTVVSPLAAPPGETAARLAALGPNPFAASERTHFARVVVLPAQLPVHARPRGMRFGARLLDLVTHGGRRMRPDPFGSPYLLVSAAHDAGDGDYGEHLRERLGPAADAIWGGCAGYPERGVLDAAGFRAFLRAGSVGAEYVFAPPGHATVTEVRAALDLRERVTELAGRDGEPRPEELRKVVEAFTLGPEPALALTLGTRARAAEAGETAEWNAAVRRDAWTYVGRDRARPRPHLPAAELSDVQGLVVARKGHRSAAFLLLRVAEPEGARRWLAGVPVASAAAAAEDAAPSAVHVAFSHAGLAALGVPEADREGFDRAFRAGMAGREPALAPGTGTRTWDGPYRDGVHVLVHVSAADDEALDAALAEHRGTLAASAGFEEVGLERAARMVDEARGLSLEHFGFADGLSQPRIAGLSRGYEGDDREELPPGEVLLGYEDVDGDAAGAVAPPELARNGSYLVLRKLEQDVPAFRAAVAAAGLPGGAEEAAAKLVGRHRDGTPLGGGTRLSFAADQDGAVCPVGAHVRRANPRDSLPVRADGSSDDPVEPQLFRRHRMLRRGIPYGPPLAEGADDDGTPRGLMFVALVGDIGRQYEFVQTQWLNDGNALRLGRDPDVFSGVSCPGAKVTVQGDPPVLVPLPARPVVTCRGGEYFLLPGRAALRRIARA